MAQEIQDNYMFINGHFEWNDIGKELSFISHKTVPIEAAAKNKAKKHSAVKSKTRHSTDKYEIEFKEDIDILDKMQFKRYYRRKVEWDESNVILIQDVKDVALYIANPDNLTRKFIMLLHLSQTDDLLRAGIIYFQFFFQTWDELRNRKEELERKIVQPKVKNTACEDLSDLRTIFALKYFSLIRGDYYNKSNETMEQDRKSSEMLIQFTIRVYWLALNKPPYPLIEQEVNRICRSDHFNKFENMRILLKRPIPSFTAAESRILRGRTDFRQTRLTAMSPLAKELIYGFHDHRLLALGQVEFPPYDDRLRYLEKLYLLPEEEFEKNNICVGVLGMNRNKFDVMLKPKHKPNKNNEKDNQELVFNMEIPPYKEYSELKWRYPTKPSSIQRNSRQNLLTQQCQIWLYRLRAKSKIETSVNEMIADSCASITF